jgi:REP element-mobilizing transposase RayT
MTYNSTTHHRRSIRLPAYDYAQAGAYFVTIVCRSRALLLEDHRFRRVVEEVWQWLAEQYQHVELDEYVIMPNHIHGVVVIRQPRSRGASRGAPTSGTARKPLGQLVGAFKTVSTKRINEIGGTAGLPVWQRNYYERVIRGDAELNHIRQYIADNPAYWDKDPENPNAVGAVREPPLRDQPSSSGGGRSP